MKRISSMVLTILIGAAFCYDAAAQKATAATSARAVYGKSVGTIYTNSVIGIRLQVPKELAIQEPQYVDLTLVPTQVPRSMFVGQRLTVKNLLTAELHPISFIITAMKLPAARINVTGEQILNDQLFRSFDGQPARSEQLGSTTFAYVDGSTRYVQNRSYAIVRHGYYISIVIAYQAKGDLDVLREYLAAADFDWDGK